jgi:energy-coupling factor transport system permease protein
LTLAAFAMLFVHPYITLTLGITVLLAGFLSHVGRPLLRIAALVTPMALTIALLNPLVSRAGETLLVRGFTLPVVGPLDITLEAVAYGALLGMKVLVVTLCFALFSLAVNPDLLLQKLRTYSLRSALTATLATRLVPVLAQDANRLAQAQRLGSGPPAGKFVIARAVIVNALERALDVAATLELRGFGGASTNPDRGKIRDPWSRHDYFFAICVVALVALIAVGLISNAISFTAYPTLSLSTGLFSLVFALAIIAISLAPFVQQRGIST